MAEFEPILPLLLRRVGRASHHVLAVLLLALGISVTWAGYFVNRESSYWGAFFLTIGAGSVLGFGVAEIVAAARQSRRRPLLIRALRSTLLRCGDVNDRFLQFLDRSQASRAQIRTACDDAHGDIEAIGAALAQRLIALEADDDLLHLLWRLEEIFRHCRRDQDLRSAQRLIAHIRSISDWVVLSYGAEIKEFASRHSEIAKSVGFMFWKPQNLVGIGQHHLEAQIDLLQQSGPNWLDPGFFSDAVAGYVEDGVIRDKSGLSKKQQEIILVAADRFALSRPG